MICFQIIPGIDMSGINFFKMTRFNKTQYLELLVQPGQASPQFTPQQYLQNKQCFSIETFSGADVTTSRTNYPIASVAILETAFLNLYCNDINLPMIGGNGQGWGLWVRDIPLVALHRVSNGTDPYVRDLFQLEGNLITWELSYVNLTNPALITVPTVMLFNIGYK